MIRDSPCNDLRIVGVYYVEMAEWIHCTFDKNLSIWCSVSHTCNSKDEKQYSVIFIGLMDRQFIGDGKVACFFVAKILPYKSVLFRLISMKVLSCF